MISRFVLGGLFLGLALYLIAGCSTSPTGRTQLAFLPDSQMNQLGAQQFSAMTSKQPIEKDPSTNRYVKCITGAILPLVGTRADFANWEVVVFKQSEANAFALPGGKIGVLTGILPVAKTPGQLAAVLGHEVGHVIARHGNERVSQSLAAQGGLILAGELSKDSKNQQLLMGLLGLGAQYGILLPFGRTQESEADRIGLDLMAQAGFDPQESVELWKNMDKNSGGNRPPEFLSTHPSNARRIHDLQANMPHALELYRQAQAEGRNPNCVR